MVVFALAGVHSARAFNSYAAWFEKLYNAVPSQYTDNGVTPESHDRWEQANTALAPYAG